jgi:hypothetical protein
MFFKIVGNQVLQPDKDRLLSNGDFLDQGGLKTQCMDDRQLLRPDQRRPGIGSSLVTDLRIGLVLAFSQRVRRTFLP